MTESRPFGRKIGRLVRKKLFWAIVALPLVIAGVLGWLTEPLEVVAPAPSPTVKLKTLPAPKTTKLAEWPRSRLDGEPAARIADSFPAYPPDDDLSYPLETP